MHPLWVSQLAHDRRARYLATADRHRLVGEASAARNAASARCVGTPVKILAISGSLNSSSSNRRLLGAVRQAASTPYDVRVYDSVGNLPHYSPDLDHDPAPAAIESLRQAVRSTDALLIATPEYAGGMPGALKNAFDWLVGSDVTAGKAAIVVSAAPSRGRGRNARRSVEHTLLTLGARVCDSFTVPIGRGAPEGAIAAKAGELLSRLRSVW